MHEIVKKNSFISTHVDEGVVSNVISDTFEEDSLLVIVLKF